MRYIFALIAATALVSCLGRGAKRAAGDNGRDSVIVLGNFTFDTASLRDTVDFGTLRAGEVAEREIRFVNNDTIPKVIIATGMSCNCMTLDYKRTPVRPGEAAVIKMKYDSKGQSGWQFKNISVQQTGDTEPRMLYVTCKVVK